MREKMTVRRGRGARDRRPVDDGLVPAGQSPLRWLLANEAGWGVPHGLFGMFAALVAGYAAAGVWRWIGGRHRPQGQGREPRSRHPG